MRTRTRVISLVAAAALVCAVSYGFVEDENLGTWPSSWPKELEALRDRARSIRIADANQEDWYEIPFDTREDFERAWPHIVGLKSHGAPIILERGPSTNFLGEVLRSGVRILGPSASGGEVMFADGAVLKPWPPWPESAKSASGDLPEYVVEQHGKWVPFAGKGGWRARVDIVLVMDGQAVGTNHIEIPAQTPIIDRRSKK
jgi:hypothetical protein